jgi:hypothetical protein
MPSFDGSLAEPVLGVKVFRVTLPARILENCAAVPAADELELP